MRKLRCVSCERDTVYVWIWDIKGPLHDYRVYACTGNGCYRQRLFRKEVK